jgi:exodeoxyribonuclease VII large subunit
LICGVGHEVDITLADLVSDHRAHTPTDAAQVAIPERALCEQQLERAWTHLARAMDAALETRSQRLQRAAESRALSDPRRLVGVRRERLASLAARLEVTLQKRIRAARERLSAAERSLKRRGPQAQLSLRARRIDAAALLLQVRLRAALERRSAGTALLGARLRALSPEAVLARGYSITTRADGSVLSSVANARIGEVLLTQLGDGRVTSSVSAATPSGLDG